jgi:uncharacterized protein (TIGR03663 family)
MQTTVEKPSSWLDHPLFAKITLNGETILWIVILILAIFSRLYMLGARVQSHDENSHVYYSWRFFKGQGFAHDPLMHGPFQFHLLATSYFMFGDNDFTARLPAALFSIAAIGFMWFYRRYLGRAGALIGATLMLISPYMLFYGRYARNEAFIELFGVITIWAILRYQETGLPRYMYWLTLVCVLHLASKETSFIYIAQALLYLGIYFIYRVSRTRWTNDAYRSRFLLALIAALVVLGIFGGVTIFQGQEALTAPGAMPTPAAVSDQATPVPLAGPSPAAVALLTLFVVAVGLGLYFLVRGYTLEGLRAERSFSILIVLFTLILPHLAAFPVRFMGWDIPTNASEVMALTSTDILHIAMFLIPLLAISVVIGLVWNVREWLINAAIFYSLFTIFYTSVFTNGAGFFTGIVGSLGYWLEQQGVQRGNQPWYYYALVQIPIYEYLPALGTLLGFVVYFVDLVRGKPAADHEVAGNGNVVLQDRSEENVAAVRSDADEEEQDMVDRPLAGQEAWGRYAPADYSTADDEADGYWDMPDRDVEFAVPGEIEEVAVFPLLGFWAVTSLIAFSLAGEKMPWLTVHIALPAILCAAWALGRLVDTTNWQLFRQRQGWLVVFLLPIFLVSGAAVMGSLLGVHPPFQGKELTQLQATSTFITSLLVAIASLVGLLYVIKPWPASDFVRVTVLTCFAVMAVLTTHTTVQANYYNYDNANEPLVYAHSAPGVKVALSQIEEISQRTTDGLAIKVAYDNETSYPYWWYLRNYPNAQYYGANPSRTLRDAPVILVGDANFGKIEPVVANLYDRFDYIRLWWPNQDYYDLTWERVKNGFTNPAMRDALFQIWLNRDYTKYGQVLGRDMSLPNWSPSARMRLYVRKDISSKLWNYGAAPSAEAAQQAADPFDEKHISLTAERIIGGPGTEKGQFNRPRDLAFAPDGSLYVADTENHRIQHLSADGTVLHIWGSFGDVTQGNAPAGTFNQPWGIAVGSDGAVYVADTWNHRVQKFSSDGKLLKAWGYFGQAEQPEAFWGPRDVAVDTSGHVFVTDTGNKRVVVFDQDGNYLTQFGEVGMGAGQFDEPVGIGTDKNGLVYVADTWNQRIQVFQFSEDDGTYQPFRSWDIPAWYGQSLDNKPYLTLDDRGSLFTVDPEGYRVLQFSDIGQPLRSWGDFGVEANTFGMPASVATATDGSIWVTDAGNNRIMVFTLPK